MGTACGPFCVFGPWQVRHNSFTGLRSAASLSLLCGSWQLKQVNPRAHAGDMLYASYGQLLRVVDQDFTGMCRVLPAGCDDQFAPFGHEPARLGAPAGGIACDFFVVVCVRLAD